MGSALYCIVFLIEKLCMVSTTHHFCSFWSLFQKKLNQLPTLEHIKKSVSRILEGMPKTLLPFFENAMTRAQALFPLDGVRPVILPPKLHQGRIRRQRNGEMVDETWCLLPSITSIGMFDSEGAVGVGSMSSVLLIWFQDRFGNPTEFVKKQIRALDWDRYAHQWDW